MFSDLSTTAIVVCVLLAVFCLGLLWWLAQLAHYCKRAVEFVETQNKNAVSLRRIAEVEGTLTELSDAYDALLTSHKKLRARIGMRKVREKAANPAESGGPPPADEVERARYKAQLREKAKADGLLR